MSAKILLVDDEMDMLELMAYNLGAQGHQILTAVTGLDALNKARRFLPDLIVLDLMLEGIDGFSVCEILRAQPSTGQVPVLVVTALGGQIARLNALSVGADDFLSKPFSPQELVRRVGEILNAHAAPRRRASPQQKRRSNGTFPDRAIAPFRSGNQDFASISPVL